MLFEVHKALPEEAETLSLILQSANKFKQSRGDNIWSRYPFSSEEALEIIRGGKTFIVTVDGVPAASLRLEENDEKIWGEEGSDDQALYIHRLTVADGFRGQGLGEKVLDWAADYAREAERSYLRLDCSSSNEGLCSYYQKLGFGIVRSELLDHSYDPTLFQRAV